MRIRERFNPRAPCGARRHSADSKRQAENISTHAPLAGRDGGIAAFDAQIHEISTHAPLAGRDAM